MGPCIFDVELIALFRGKDPYLYHKRRIQKITVLFNANIFERIGSVGSNISNST